MNSYCVPQYVKLWKVKCPPAYDLRRSSIKAPWVNRIETQQETKNLKKCSALEFESHEKG